MILCKNRNKKVGLYAMVVMTSLCLAAVWAALIIPETTLAAKPGGDDEPKALNGSATFRDAAGDRVKSDGGGSYYDSGTGKKGDTVLDLGDAFFRLSVKEDKNDVGRRFHLDFSGLDIDSTFFPASPYVWELHVQGTLQEWRAQPEGVAVLRDGDLFFGTKGWDGAHVNYGTGGSWDGDQLTVTKIGTDFWTIESFAPGVRSPEDPGDFAQFWREDESFGYAPMPFKIDYDGTATAP